MVNNILVILIIVLDLLAFWLIRRITIIDRNAKEYYKRYSTYSSMLCKMEQDGIDIQEYYNKVRKEVRKDEE